jgi:phenazine biosynthesis protein phzE
MNDLYKNKSVASAIIEKDGEVTTYKGEFHSLSKLEDIQQLFDDTRKAVVFVVPFCSIRERGYEAIGNERIMALTADEVSKQTRDQALKQIEDTEFTVRDFSPQVSDDVFASTVEKIKKHEIEGGEAVQIVYSRPFDSCVESDDVSMEQAAHSTFRRLLEQQGQYMTFLYTVPDASDIVGSHKYFVGATPERHLTIQSDGTVIMNPIAGTLKKGDKETFKERLLAFLRDPKEIYELFQVVDE